MRLSGYDATEGAARAVVETQWPPCEKAEATGDISSTNLIVGTDLEATEGGGLSSAPGPSL